MSHFVFAPYQFDLGGRTAEADLDVHVRHLIDAVLFTAPGERVNRPTFGAGLGGAVFSPAADDLFTAARVVVEGALQQWLGDLIDIDDVDVAGDDATLRIRVVYRVRRTGAQSTVELAQEGPG